MTKHYNKMNKTRISINTKLNPEYALRKSIPGVKSIVK